MPKKETGKTLLRNIEKYIFPANLELIRCVDERQSLDASNGVEIPGGIYGIIDGIKYFLHVSEEEAWNIAHMSGIPIGGHIDQHHGPRGCGYGKLVEDSPEIVDALESIPAQDRLDHIRLLGGTIQTYMGDHKPTGAIINRRTGYSFDPDQAMLNGLGIFCFDRWAAYIYGRRLQQYGINNATAFAKHMESVYRKTVTALTDITDFIEIK